MLATNLSAGIALLSLLLVNGRGQLWLLYGVAVYYGVALAATNAIQPALLTDILPRELLPSANAALQAASQAARLLGPLGGAALYAATGGATVALVDASTFAVAVASLAAIREARHVTRPTAGSLWREFSMGMRHVLATDVLRHVVLAQTVTILVMGFAETFLFQLLDRLGHSPSFFGVLMTAQGAGGIIGATVAAGVINRFGDVRSVVAGTTLMAIGTATLLLFSLPVVLLAMLVFGIGAPLAIVGLTTAAQWRTPAHVQSRTQGAVASLISLALSISIAVGAAVSTLADVRVLIGMTAAIMAISAASLQRATSKRGRTGPIVEHTPAGPHPIAQRGEA